MEEVARDQQDSFEGKNDISYRIKDSMRGRSYLDDHDIGYRNFFQRDRERIISTSSFRRLGHKTHLFINPDRDYYRTALTHVIEVSQIGQRLSLAIGANEDLVDAICSAYKLGTPPFGYAGEVVLARKMRGYGGFDHISQCMRIVTELEQFSPGFSGLNLTYEVREGILKHLSEYDISSVLDYDPSLRGHIEAQIVCVANDIATTVADLDDSLKAEIITPYQLEELDIHNCIFEAVDLQGARLDSLERRKTISKLLDLVVNDVTNFSLENIKRSGVKSSVEIQRLHYNIVNYSLDFLRVKRELNDFLYRNVYRHPDVLRSYTLAENVIEKLFDVYTKNPEILPKEWIKLIYQHGLERTVCDYIAGMTDRFAIEEYQNHTINIGYISNKMVRTNIASQTRVEVDASNNKPLRCFLSYRFNSYGKLYAQEIKQFLELQSIDVLTGEKYEPRGISQKVRDLLAKDLDFVILIVAEDGESMWTRDEIATVRAENKPIIPLVVRDSKFEAGLFGDLEWIPFTSGHVSETFSKLIEGINFIRSEIEQNNNIGKTK